MTKTDPRIVALVSARYWEMQGLRGVLLGSIGFLFGAFCSRADVVFGDRPSLVSAAVALVLGVVGMSSLDRYYARAFGRVQPQAAVRRFAAFGIPGLMILMTSVGLATGAGPGSFFLAGVLLELRAGIRDWRWRWYHLLGAAASLASFYLAASSPGWNDALYKGLMLTGAATVATGALDHALLRRGIRPHARLDPTPVLSSR